MSDRRAVAVVRLVVEVPLAQPWADGSKIEEIYRAGSKEAIQMVSNVLTASRIGVSKISVDQVRVEIEEKP